MHCLVQNVLCNCTLYAVCWCLFVVFLYVRDKQTDRFLFALKKSRCAAESEREAQRYSFVFWESWLASHCRVQSRTQYTCPLSIIKAIRVSVHDSCGHTATSPPVPVPLKTNQSTRTSRLDATHLTRDSFRQILLRCVNDEVKAVRLFCAVNANACQTVKRNFYAITSQSAKEIMNTCG